MVEGGCLEVADETHCALELRYRWRYGGVPGGDTVAEPLGLAFEITAPFHSESVQWYRLLRGSDHVGYVLRRRDGTLILTDYDHAGTVDFYFTR